MRWDSEPKHPTNVEKSFQTKKKKNEKKNKKMFTYSNTTEEMWFPMLSETAEPNTISLLRNFCCIATKLIEMRSKYKTKKQWLTVCWPVAHISFGTNCHSKSLLNDWRNAKYLPPPSVESRSKALMLWGWITQISKELYQQSNGGSVPPSLPSLPRREQ